MTTWRITHIDAARRRHVLHLLAASAQAAQDRAEALHGPALYCACIRVVRGAA